ncbi:hypothetical protein CXG81DRAFT_13679 [Caulochytrium protostelioides]|uniref:DDHD domain-containing protein n=1 Tax=Caulochytrium protostelioides TaxID=1555241 RepID=A0A4P9X4S8_9FUNG|nr:hypothetical protein CXG81DRAFT_13679 [Caulochytrium protostelioides]|eukprot:RKP00065.1 hypothetical protein CXG81DRAFT_13679 [Caulochytrium protostelioides]
MPGLATPLPSVETAPPPHEITGFPAMPDLGGVQVLPVQWRHKIMFGMQQGVSDRGPGGDGESGGGGESGTAGPGEDDEVPLAATLENITLEGVPSIRSLVSDVVVDVLLYMTPKYRRQMCTEVAAELNRLYALWMQKNPDFNGKVSIYGHSLGSLLAFDILCNQPHPQPKSPNGSAPSPTAPQAPYPRLEFDVEHLIFVGSPLGLFLLLQGDQLTSDLILEMPLSHLKAPQKFSVPVAKRMYNLFHPHDPVAYRVEPLVNPRYSRVPPVALTYTKGGLKGTVLGIQGLSNEIASRSRTVLESVKVGIVSTTEGFMANASKMVTMPSAHGAASASASAPAAVAAHPQPADPHLWHLNPMGRLDFALQEGMLENPYLSALGVHMAYWADQDIAYFLLSQFYDLDVPQKYGAAGLAVATSAAGSSGATATDPSSSSSATAAASVSALSASLGLSSASAAPPAPMRSSSPPTSFFASSR